MRAHVACVFRTLLTHSVPLSLSLQDWLPEHFSSTMVGNHIDCRVLASLTSEHLPKLAARLTALDVSVQLLTTRWFLCLWSSVLPLKALHRMWDLLFVTGPAATMQTALACMSLCASIVLEARDIGDALTSVKEVLRLSGDGEQLVEIALYRIAAHLTRAAIRVAAPPRRLHGTSARLVAQTNGAIVRAIQSRAHASIMTHLATRRLLKLQRGSGLDSAPRAQTNVAATNCRLCGLAWLYNLVLQMFADGAQTSLLRLLSIDYDAGNS